MSILFVSDLHLPPAASPLREAFIGFLNGPAREAEALYLLGDLFEYWIGDDASAPLYAAEIAALASLTASGVPVYFQHGNRDFLVGDDFALLSGVRVLPDPATVRLGSEVALLSHGDLLCTDDVGYRRWRRFSRNALAQRIFRHLPRRLRERIAGGLRSGSRDAKQHKPMAIMDANENAVREALQASGARWLIHGHTHRPAEHDYKIGGRAARRIVLADWRDERREYLEYEAGVFRRIDLGTVP
jgi:UDP-2,3-diacylglucosamine hydrolase